jgi:hypothetical protein
VACFDACGAAFVACQEPCNNDPACETLCEDQRTVCNAACEPQCVLPRDICVESGGRFHLDPKLRLFKGCASSGCHSQSNPNGIASNLDLSTEPAVFETAIGQTAFQTQQGQHSVEGDQSPLRFGRAMPRIDPGNPGNSYLLYKLVVNPFNYYNDNGIVEPQLDASIRRLRASVVVGLPMPTETAGGALGLELMDPTGALSFTRLQAISAWIAHGAVLSCE